MTKKGRFTIGVLIGMLEGSYQSRIWPGIVKRAEELDVNLVLFVGKTPNSPYGSDIQHNIIYEIASKRNVDGIIILSGTFGNFMTKEELVDFCKRYYPLPMVGIDLAIENISSILADNKSGMIEAVNHLIKNHDYKNIAFIKGPENHPEADQRYNAYVETLEKNKIKFDSNLVTQGNFVMETGIKAVQILMDKRKVKFDAIIAANDDMALGAFKGLRDRGLYVPNDVAVVGFDDTEVVKYFNPPLSSVKPPLYEQAVLAVDILVSQLKGEKVPKEVILPTEFVVRQSCGCLPQSIKYITDYVNEETEKRDPKKSRIKGLKKKIFNDTIKNLAKLKINSELITDWVKRVSESIYDNLEKSVISKEFLHIIMSAPYCGDSDSKENTLLHEILGILKFHLLKYFKETSIRLLIEKHLDSALILISEMALRPDAYNVISVEERKWTLREVRQILSTTFELQELTEVIVKDLPSLGIFSCHISLYKGDVIKESSLKWKIPEKSESILAYNKQGTYNLKNNSVIFKTHDLVPPGFLCKKNRYSIILMPLFFREEHFGNILYELGPKEETIYETLRGQISSSIKGALLFNVQIETSKELKEALSALENSNKKLKTMSLRDDLTGLYNRRGFITHGNQHLKLAYRTKRNCLLYFIDLDGLKRINDNYGHNEGDAAIVNTAKILKLSFRQADILARFGGDEFAVLAVNTYIESIEEILKRLEENIYNFNANNKKPYKLSMSIGIAPFDIAEKANLEDLLKEADRQLYEEKNRKKLKSHRHNTKIDDRINY